MWEPVGPLPASVYRRRRWVAITSTAAAIVLVAWCVAATLAPPAPAGDGTTARVASLAAQSAPQPASPSPVAPPSSSDAQPPTPQQPGTAEPESTEPSAPLVPAVVPGSTAAAPAATSEELRPDGTPRRSVPVATPVPVPPTGPVPCTNAMLAVTAEIDRTEHRVGERPVLRLVVMNATDRPCVRDLDPARQEIVVWSGDGAKRLWSSNDCTNASSPDLRTLVPGQPVAFAVTWVGRTSMPGCAAARARVPAGDYRVMTRVDDVISAPTMFVRNP